MVKIIAFGILLFWYQKYFFLWRCGPRWAVFMKLLDNTQRRTTVGRTPLDEWSARRRDFYLTTHNIHNRQTSILPAGFEPTLSAFKRPQTYALDPAAIWTVLHKHYRKYNTIIQKYNNPIIAVCSQNYARHINTGGTVVAVVKVLCYKSECRWFDPSWCHWSFSLT